MKKSAGTIIVVIIILSQLTSCAPIAAFKSDADERLFRSIESGGGIAEVIESVADGASIDRLKRGRLVSINMVEFAVQNGREDIAEWLVTNGADVNYKTSIMGQTLLMSMASAGEYGLCELLLENGAQIDTKDRISYTALEYAFKAGGDIAETDIDSIVTLLIESGAEVTRETLSAVLNGYSGKGDGDCRYGLVRRVVGLMMEKGIEPKLRPALEAAILGYGSHALELIDKGGVSQADRQEILFYTAAFGSADTLKKLEEKGQDLKTLDKDGNTLLITAVRYGNTGVISYLVTGKQDFYAKNRLGETAFGIAEEKGDAQIIALLEANMPARGAMSEDTQRTCCCCCGGGCY